MAGLLDELSIGRSVRMRSPALSCLDGIAISFGWDSTGMGKKRGFEIVEIVLTLSWRLP